MRWDSRLYDESFAIITQLGAGVIELLAPRPGERIIDLGCGTGALTAEIAAAGAEVVGIDASEAMIARARELYPHLRFEVARGKTSRLRRRSMPFSPMPRCTGCPHRRQS